MRRRIAGFALVLTLLLSLALLHPDTSRRLLALLRSDEAADVDIETLLEEAAGTVESGVDRSVNPSPSHASAHPTEPPATEPTDTTPPQHDHREAETSDQPAAGETTLPTNPKTTLSPDPSRDLPPTTPVVKELTGNVSGTVTDTAQLVGRVNLVGDLIIDGGTLLARPGVTVDGNGFQIMVHSGGRVDWRGTPVFTWSGDGSNANLTRDINLRNLRRIIFMGGAGPSVIQYVAVHSSGTPGLGDYPLHWHLNYDTTRGTIVEGVAVVDGRHHAFVPHGSHGITFRDTIAWQVQGDAYWWDPPGSNDCGTKFAKFCTADNSNDTTYDHALAAKVTNGPGDLRGYRLSGFHLGAGSGNVVKNSLAREITPTHVKDCSGFHWPESANQNDGGNVWTFASNRTAASECHGIFVWQNDGNPHVISGFSGGGVDHGAYGNIYHYKNLTVPYLEVHAIGWQIGQSQVGDVTALKHVAAGTVTFTDVTFDSFTISDGQGEPAIYVLNGTNLGCGDIVHQDTHPASQVIIDGASC